MKSATFFRLSRMLAGAALVMLSGCSTIIPGLRVDVEDPEKDSFRIVPHTDTEAEARRPYRVRAITPKLLGELSENQQKLDFSGAAIAVNPGINSDYQIGPGDVLSVVVWNHPELTNPSGGLTFDINTSGRLVAADGTLLYPYVGVRKVAGMTAREVQRMITDELVAVVKQPQVDVRVIAYRSKRIQVSGEVVNPGVVNLDDLPKTVLDVVNERGGLKTTASRRRALLTRGNETFDVNLLQTRSLDSRAFARLQAGDVVYVPDASDDQVFMLGELGKIAPVVLANDHLSLTEALTQAGGLDRLTANDSGVLVFRRAVPGSDDPRPVVYTLDMSRVQGLLLAGEFNLQPRDVVYVQATGFAQYNLIINQLLPTVSTVFQLQRLVSGR